MDCAEARVCATSSIGGLANPARRATWWQETGIPRIKRHLAAHPILLGCCFVLRGYGQLQPSGNVKDLVIDLLLVAGAILVLQLVLASLIEHPRKPAMLASLCAVFFCFFGDWRVWCGEWLEGTGWSWLKSAKWQLPLMGTVFLALCAWLLRTRRTLVKSRTYLDVVAIALVAPTAAGIVFAPAAPQIPPGYWSNAPLRLGGNPPDIYYILTDAYTSPESLKTYWHYDDSPFVNSLTGLGFRVIKNAHGNATFTPKCLATYLGMNYPPVLAAGRSLASQAAYYCQFIRKAEAPMRLKASGYDIRALSLFDVAGEARYYIYPNISDPTLGSLLWNRTALGYLDAYRVRRTLGDTNLKIFSLLPEIAAERTGRPKFVYAHLMMPHPPYLFDEKGRRIWSGMREDDDHPEFYLGQLIYENRLLTNAVAGILRNSKAPPIIIIQGDHGYRALPGPHQTEEATTILNALYLPGSGDDWLYRGITPVNTFRVVFNHYFDGNYPYLPDVLPSGLTPFVSRSDAK